MVFRLGLAREMKRLAQFIRRLASSAQIANGEYDADTEGGKAEIFAAGSEAVVERAGGLNVADSGRNTICPVHAGVD
jgi:hypothetical protein